MEIKRKGEEMAGPRYGEEKKILQIRGRGQLEAETFGRVQSSHNPEPYEAIGRGRKSRRIEMPFTPGLRLNTVTLCTDSPAFANFALFPFTTNQ